METAGTKPNRNATKNNNTQMAKQLNTYINRILKAGGKRFKKREAFDMWD
jgi:hypothetical protein